MANAQCCLKAQASTNSPKSTGHYPLSFWGFWGQLYLYAHKLVVWTEEQVAWVDSRLTFKGRIVRDGWIEQAKKLAAGEETEFAKRAKDEGTYDN